MFRSSKAYPYLLITPAMLALFAFVVYPMGYLVYLSLTNWNIINPVKKFIGLTNYATLFGREEFYTVAWNTFVYTFFVVAVTLVLSLLLALWFNKNTKFNIFGQAAIFTPHIISLVSISMVWMWIMDPEIGLLNYILGWVGIPPLRWLQSSDTAMFSIILVSVWKGLGYYTLVILASLQSIPPSIYEACELDNASKTQVFFKITLPMISPQLFFLLIVMTIASFKVFDTIRIMTGGGPNNATNMLVYYIYEYAFVNMKIGYASAVGVVLLGFVSIITVIYFKVLSKRVHYQ